MAWLQSCKQLCLAAHAAHDARHDGEQWCWCRLRQDVGDHLGCSGIVTARDTLDVDAVLGDCFSHAVEPHVDVPRPLASLVIRIVSRALVIDVQRCGLRDVLATTQLRQQATCVLDLNCGCAQRIASASTVDNATVGCSLDRQSMAAPASISTKPVVLRAVSGQSPQSASE